MTADFGIMRFRTRITRMILVSAAKMIRWKDCRTEAVVIHAINLISLPKKSPKRGF